MVIHDTGKANKMGSTSLMSLSKSTLLPNMALHIPNASASLACMKSIQKIVEKVPSHILHITPFDVAFFQYKAQKYTGRKTMAHNPMKMDVARAMILSGNM